MQLKMTESDMYLSGMSIPDVSSKTNTPMSTLRFRFKKLGILRSRSESIALAAKQGKLGGGNRGKKITFTDEWRENISKSKTGVGVGYSVKPNGYIEITMGKNKGRLQHVVLMEESIGRKLFSNECVHHIDHNKQNNLIENLQLMTRAEHSRLHAIENNTNRNRDEKGRYK